MTDMAIIPAGEATPVDAGVATPPAAPQFERAVTNEDGSFKVANINGGQARMELSNQWLRRPADERFLSLSALQASVKARAEATTTILSKTKLVTFVAPEPEKIEDTHILKVVTDGGEVEPTHWSFGQLAGLAGAPAGYLRRLPSQIVAQNLNYGLRYLRQVEDVKLYARTGEDLRAATGPDYGRIFDHEVVEAVRQIAGDGIGDTNWKVPGVMDWRTMVYNPNVAPTLDTTTLYASDRDVFIFLVDDRNPIVVGKVRDPRTGDMVDDIMFRGFYVKNSEVGAGAMTIATFYLRAICCNRIMWGVEGFETISMRHSKNAPARFIEEARPALIEMTNRSVTRLVDGVEKAKAAKVAEDKDSALDFLQNRSFSKQQAQKVLDIFEKEEGGHARTAWDMAQGITAMARSVAHQDDRVAMEKIAGRILDKVA